MPALRQSICLEQPVAVIDIGSNSVRLVIFEGVARNPTAAFNEKALCAIGRNMVTTGRLDAAGMDEALRILARFRVIIADRGITDIHALATAAVRDARNGEAFVARASELLEAPIRVLSGEEEAELAALGVLSGVPDADGLVGDLGGGSLELMPVSRGEATGPGTTLPFGPLRLMDMAGGRIDRARTIVDEGLRRVPGLDRLKGRTLYAVGGIWRALARVHIADTKYPMSILQHYEIPRASALQVTQMISGLSRKSLERIAEIPRRRVEALPFGALVMERLLRVSELGGVVISAHGVREGLVYRLLPAELRARDPLIETCRDWADNRGRGAAAAGAVASFVAPLFAEEGDSERRLREAACLLAEIGWRHHPDYRARLCMDEVRQGPFLGIDHRGRALLALAVFHRYAGDSELPESRRLSVALEPALGLVARRIGLACRLAFNVAGPAFGLLDECSLKLAARELLLVLPRKRADLAAEIVQRRLDDLAAAFDRAGRIEIR